MQSLNQLMKAHRRVQRVITRCCDQVLPPYALSVEQYHMLVEVEELRHELGVDPSMGCIAVQLAKPANTMSRLVQELEAQGFVRRYRDAIDRRMYRVCLTNHACSCLQGVQQELESTWTQARNDDMTAERYSEAAYALRLGTQTFDVPDGDRAGGAVSHGSDQRAKFPRC